MYLFFSENNLLKDKKAVQFRDCTAGLGDDSAYWKIFYCINKDLL